ncbi:MAG: hypothetical protein GYB37_07045 [Algicola sp.]|nr:hypothetical protein [Algicola sp.]
MKFVLLLLIPFFGYPQHSRLSIDQHQDSSFVLVRKMAEELVREGNNAGGGYNEVWIRDLNSFMNLAITVQSKDKIKEDLLRFFLFQEKNGEILDGIVRKEIKQEAYNYRYSKLAPEYAGYKNSVETDQETSLVQAVSKYIRGSNDREWLYHEVSGKSILQRLEDALCFLMNHRFSQEYGLLFGGTTVDWGDVQPEDEWGVELNSDSHYAIDIYDNAMLLIAIDDLVDLLESETSKDKWRETRKKVAENIMAHLWDGSKFKPHIYLDESPFPNDFDEDSIHFHGGTYIAIEAGLLNRNQIKEVYELVKQNVEKAGAASLGLTVYPPYPKDFFKNPYMEPYSYQNGGDWTWFGGRMVKQLLRYGFVDEALEELMPMVDRVLNNKDFYEWYSMDNRPSGSNRFRGSAGVLWEAILLLHNEEHSNKVGNSPKVRNN